MDSGFFEQCKPAYTVIRDLQQHKYFSSWPEIASCSVIIGSCLRLNKTKIPSFRFQVL